MKYFILLIIIASLGISSCGYNCSGYDLFDKSVISFRLEDVIVYESNIHDTIKITVTDFYAEGTTKTKGVYTTYECNPQAYYSTSGDDFLVIKEVHKGRIQVYFCDDDAYSLLFKSEEKSKNQNVKFTQNKDINGITFSFVWEVEDLSGKRRIDKFIKADSLGIVEFHDKNTGLTWSQLR